LVKKWHQRKTEIYKAIIASGKIAIRPGVKRLSEEALCRGWVLGVCSTSAREAVESVLLSAVGRDNAGRFSLLLAGDVVKTKKPAPDIYLLAASQLQVGPEQCVVVEDSRNGLLSAVAAGMKCVITINDYTREEDFSKADLVLNCLGDAGGEACRVLANRSGVPVHGMFGVDTLEKLLVS